MGRGSRLSARAEQAREDVDTELGTADIERQLASIEDSLSTICGHDPTSTGFTALLCFPVAFIAALVAMSGAVEWWGAALVAGGFGVAGVLFALLYRYQRRLYDVDKPRLEAERATLQRQREQLEQLRGDPMER